jgi:hypothetical protein
MLDRLGALVGHHAPTPTTVWQNAFERSSSKPCIPISGPVEGCSTTKEPRPTSQNSTFQIGAFDPRQNASCDLLITRCRGQHHLTNNTCTSDLLPMVAGIKVAGIIIVDLPTWFDHEQEKSNASPDYHCEPDKKCFHHDGLQGLRPIDCTDDGENGFPRLAHAARATCLWLSGLRAKHGVLPLLAHEVRPCLVYGEAVLEVG